MPRTRRPIATDLLIAFTVMLAVAAATRAKGFNIPLDEFHVASAPGGVWNGSYFSLLAAAFININPITLAFVAVWMYVLGKRIELAFGAEALLGLVMAGAIVPNAWELGLDRWPVLGGIGIVYTLLGFLLVARRTHASRVADLRLGTRRIVFGLLIVWIVFGALYPPYYFSGMFAPVVGLLLGLAIGGVALQRGPWRWGAAAALALVLAGMAVALTTPTFNPQWRVWKAARYAAHGEYANARRMLAPLLRSHSALTLNSVAYLLATHPNSGLRDGRRALEAALGAYQLTQGQNAGILDTLAAAYAENGDWPHAAEAEREALALMRANEAGEQSGAEVDLLNNQRLIEAHRPIRDVRLLTTLGGAAEGGASAPEGSTTTTSETQPALHRAP